MPSEHTVFEAALTYNQGQIFSFWEELSSDDQSHLLESIEDINFHRLPNLMMIMQSRTENIEDRLLPPDPKICGSLGLLRDNQPKLLDQYLTTALKAVRDSKVAVLLLAGGQGTRLGVNFPKGLFKPNLPSGRSLYHLQAGHIARVCEMVHEKFGVHPKLPWYIMTSENTSKTTEAFFAANNYFNLDSRDVLFFSQFTMPAFDNNGKILLESKHKISRAPDGNGGLYRALRDHGVLEDMQARGVEYVQIYCVDNILVKVPDLYFIGFSIRQSCECSAEVVQKVNPTEPIGVVGMVDGRYRVVEYSEITAKTAGLCASDESLSDGPDEAAAGDVLVVVKSNGGSHDDASVSTANSVAKPPQPLRRPPRRLVYSHGNICVHFATREFLQRVSQPEVESRMPYHIARKKVPHVDLATGDPIEPSLPNGVKLEKFVFDVFPLADRFAIWEVPRDEYFSPIKNGPKASADCPQTARRDLLAYHARLAQAAGARLHSDSNGTPTGCWQKREGDLPNQSPMELEISPLVSYCGENLSCLYGKELRGTCLVELSPETKQPVLILPTKGIHAVGCQTVDLTDDASSATSLTNRHCDGREAEEGDRKNRVIKLCQQSC